MSLFGQEILVDARVGWLGGWVYGGKVFYSPSNHLIQVKNVTLRAHKPEFV